MAPPTCHTGSGQHQFPLSACKCSNAPRAHMSRARRVNKNGFGGEPEEPEVAKAVIPSMPRRERKAAAPSAQPSNGAGPSRRGRCRGPKAGVFRWRAWRRQFTEGFSAQGVPAFLHAGLQMMLNPCIGCLQAARFESMAYLRFHACGVAGGAENHCWCNSYEKLAVDRSFLRQNPFPDVQRQNGVPTHASARRRSSVALSI